MKSHIPFLWLPVLIVLLTACKKDFLDSQLRTTLVREEYVTDLQKCKELVDGLYLTLSSSHGAYHTIYPEIIADNIKPLNGQTALLFHYNWVQAANETDMPTISASGENINGYSFSFYQLIVTGNFLLEKIAAFRQQDAGLANDLQGQVQCIRALAYFNLVNAFAQSYNYTAGGTHPGIVYKHSTDWTEPVKGRSTVAFIYSRILEDLNSAVTLLPSQNSSPVFFSQLSAKALLARVLLFKQDYEKAAVLAAEVARLVPLTTAEAGYPNDLFKALPSGKTEVLLQLLPGNSISMGHTGGGIFGGRYFKGSKQFVATSDVSTLLAGNPKDIRKAWVTFTAGSWNITKFPSGLVPDVSPADAAYLLPLIRSSEMYLTAAEAFMQQQREDSARLYLNAIRKRARIDTLGTDIGGAALLDSIYTERRKELAFEGLRMYDLLRWKKGVHRKDALSPSAQSLPYPSDRAIAPLPVRDVTEGQLTQNPAY